MIRRTFLIAIAAGELSGCTRPAAPVDYMAPTVAGSPPPSKIQRLLVWLPPAQATDAAVRGRTTPVRLFDFQAFGDELKKQLEGHGVQMVIGTSSGFELDRADEQRKLRDQLKPTHRLEVDVSNVVALSTMAGLINGTATINWLLYNGQEAKAALAGAFSVTGKQDRSIVTADDLVKHLADSGYL